jgi:hypothetical protein
MRVRRVLFVQGSSDLEDTRRPPNPWQSITLVEAHAQSAQSAQTQELRRRRSTRLRSPCVAEASACEGWADAAKNFESFRGVLR